MVTRVVSRLDKLALARKVIAVVIAGVLLWVGARDGVLFKYDGPSGGGNNGGNDESNLAPVWSAPIYDAPIFDAPSFKDEIRKLTAAPRTTPQPAGTTRAPSTQAPDPSTAQIDDIGLLSSRKDIVNLLKSSIPGCSPSEFDSIWFWAENIFIISLVSMGVYILIVLTYLIASPPKREWNYRKNLRAFAATIVFCANCALLALAVILLYKKVKDCGDAKLGNSFKFGYGFYLFIAAWLVGAHGFWIGLVQDKLVTVQEQGHPLLPQHAVDLIMAEMLLDILGGNRPRLRLNNNNIQNFTPAPVPPPTCYGPSNRKALLVGINYYGTGGELSGCINDVNRLAQRLHGAYEIRVLTDDEQDYVKQPTKANIQRGMAWLVEGVSTNDNKTLFMHFSGHGSQEKDETGDEIDGLDETICPVDYETEGMISDDELQHDLVKRIPRGNRLLSIMDCCHSGTVLDLPYYAIASETEKKCKMMGDQMSEKNRIDCDAIMISGCEDASTSADVQAVGKAFVELADNKAGGALTSAFLVATQQNKSHSLVSLLFAIRKSLSQKGFDQIPQVSSSAPYDVNDTKFDLFPDSGSNYDPSSVAYRPQQQQQQGGYVPPASPPGAPGPPGLPMLTQGIPNFGAMPLPASNPYTNGSSVPSAGRGAPVPPAGRGARVAENPYTSGSPQNAPFQSPTGPSQYPSFSMAGSPGPTLEEGTI